ncbi:MAG: hypothetical protein IIT33_01275 [Prevotella sp.]|nr:hypothetical protein [Prevotella sp.]
MELASRLGYGPNNPPFSDIVSFAEQGANQRLYPNQALILKTWTLAEQYTETELATLHNWMSHYMDAEPTGVSPDLFDRIETLKAQGYPWFTTIIAVLGRRASKTFLTGIMFCWQTIKILSDPRFSRTCAHRQQPLSILIGATKKEQVLSTLYAAYQNMVLNTHWLEPNIIKWNRDRIDFISPWDAVAERDNEHPQPTLSVRAVSSNSNDVRGGSIIGFVLDEAFFTRSGDSMFTGDAAIEAASPALNQFGRFSLQMYPSSPWTRTGRVYELYTAARKPVDQGGDPSLNATQLESWRLYEGWQNGLMLRKGKPSTKTVRMHDETGRSQVILLETSAQPGDRVLLA